jgi:hypothetical protein
MTLWAVPLLAAEVKSSDVRKFKKRLALLVQGKREAGLYDLIEELAELDDPRVVILIPTAAVILPSSSNYRAALEGLAGLKNEESVTALISMLGKRQSDFRQKVLILDAFGKRQEAATLKAILEQLEDRIPQIQVAAIQAAAARRAKEAIPPLIDLLEETWELRDRTWFETRAALLRITGQDFDAIEDWKKFWEASGATFDPEKVGKEEGPTKVAVKRTEDSVEFFGSEIFSRNLVFVIDVSGSMIMYDDVTGSRDPEKEGQRLHRARQQLIQALRKLKRGTLFNIITFSDKILPWQKKLRPAGSSSVASAIKFVSNFQARGATHTDDALKEAFKDLSVDTIVLLTDGAPMRADDRNAQSLIQKIVDWVADTNSSRKVKIDTFGFEGLGSWPENVPGVDRRRLPPPPTPDEVKMFVEFLKKLASESGGTYRPIK